MWCGCPRVSQLDQANATRQRSYSTTSQQQAIGRAERERVSPPRILQVLQNELNDLEEKHLNTTPCLLRPHLACTNRPAIESMRGGDSFNLTFLQDVTSRSIEDDRNTSTGPSITKQAKLNLCLTATSVLSLSFLVCPHFPVLESTLSGARSLRTSTT